MAFRFNLLASLLLSVLGLGLLMRSDLPLWGVVVLANLLGWASIGLLVWRYHCLHTRSVDFIQGLIDVIPDPVFIKKRDSTYLMVNQAFADYRGVDKAAFQGFRQDNPPSAKRILSRHEDLRALAGEHITKEERTTRKTTGEEVFRLISKRGATFVDGQAVVMGVEQHITRWKVAERELKRIAQEDSLTGLATRRHFSHQAERAIERATRYLEALSVFIFDVDHFKAINDQYGHQVGDEVLMQVADLLRHGFRKTDLVGRWGGEEFTVLLPHTKLHLALQVAQRLCAQLAQIPLQTSRGPLTLTLSGGGAELVGGEGLESLLARADTQLYRAKHQGRNRLEIGEAIGPLPQDLN